LPLSRVRRIVEAVRHASPRSPGVSSSDYPTPYVARPARQVEAIAPHIDDAERVRTTRQVRR